MSTSDSGDNAGVPRPGYESSEEGNEDDVEIVVSTPHAGIVPSSDIGDNKDDNVEVPSSGYESSGHDNEAEVEIIVTPEQTVDITVGSLAERYDASTDDDDDEVIAESISGAGTKRKSVDFQVKIRMTLHSFVV